MNREEGGEKGEEGSTGFPGSGKKPSQSRFKFGFPIRPSCGQTAIFRKISALCGQ